MLQRKHLRHLRHLRHGRQRRAAVAAAVCLLVGASVGALVGASAGTLAAQGVPSPVQSPPQSRSVALRIIAINDFHGHLEPGNNFIPVPDPADASRTLPLASGGAAYLATRVRELRAGAQYSIFVAAGDLVGASPLVSGLFHDEPTIAAMNAMGLELNAVGNHEFDRGADELLRLAKGGCAPQPDRFHQSCAAAGFHGARFPFIAANVTVRDGAPFLAPGIVREFGGVKVGFVGAVTRSTPGIVQPAGVRDLRFSAEAQALNAAAAALRAQGAQTIIALVHEGGDTDGGINDCANPRGAIFDIERELDPAIAVVLSGHTHQAYNCRIGGRVVIQAASFGRLVSVVDLQIDAASGRPIAPRTEARNEPVPNGLRRYATAALQARYPALAPDTAVAAIVDDYRERAAPVGSRPVGRIAESFDRNATAGGDHALGRLIADAQLAATRVHGAQIAFTNPGGIRTDLRSRRDVGTVTFADAYAVQPFGNALVTLTLTGAQLRQLLEAQWSPRKPGRARMLQPSRGFSYTWDARRPAGQRIVADSMRLDGRVIDADAQYRVTVNDFLAGGGDSFRVLREARDAHTSMLDIEALVRYLESESALQPLHADRRARIARVGGAPATPAAVR